jgi:hypothetical protein
MLGASPAAGGASGSGMQMSQLRVYVETVSAQLRLAKAKEESDTVLIDQLQRENGRLQQLADSASEVG